MKKTDKEVDLSALSRERLIEMYTSLKKTDEAQEAEIYKLRMALSELSASNDSKNQTILRDNFNAIIIKSEHEPDADGKSPINEAEETVRKKGGRTPGSKNFLLSGEELWKMVGPEDVITIEPDEVLNGDGGSAAVRFGAEDSKTQIQAWRQNLPGKVRRHLPPQLPFPFAGRGHRIRQIRDEHIPMYRHAGWLNQEKHKFNSGVLSGNAIRTAELLTPITELMKRKMVENSNGVIHIDETTLKVIDTHDGNRKKSYIFVYGSSYYSFPVLFYDFSRSRRTTGRRLYLTGSPAP